MPFAKETTSDAAVLKRTWIMVDFDARREAGISSSDPEHDAALARAARCCDLLQSVGFESLIWADSGNGAHVLVAVDLENTTKPPARSDPSRDLVQQFHRKQTASFSVPVDGLYRLRTGVAGSSGQKLLGPFRTKFSVRT